MKYLSALYASLRALAIAAVASVAVGSAHAQDPSDADTAAWNRARQEHTVEAYQRYLELYPLGAHSAEAFQAMVELLLVLEGPPEAAGDALPGIDMY
jgi:hypothetical protein